MASSSAAIRPSSSLFGGRSGRVIVPAILREALAARFLLRSGARCPKVAPMKRALGSDRRALCGLVGGIAALAAAATSGCSADESPKAWNALSTCLAGKAAQKPLAERFKELRLIQLANPSSPGNKEAWPARCGRYAD